MAAAAAALLALLCAQSAWAQPSEQLRLGFLLPFPRGDSAIPPRLADEWISAAKLAVEILAPQYEQLFLVDKYVARSNCSQAGAEEAARKLIADDVVAVVGPACSEAVIGANRVLRPSQIPFISFAATADQFQEKQYDTFFRTVYGDRFQAKAIAAVVSQMAWKNLYLFYSDDTYGRNLAQRTVSALADAQLGVNTVMVKLPYPPPPSIDAYKQYFYESATWGFTHTLLSSNKSTAVLVAATPNVVQSLWQAALTIPGMLEYPWWYLASDGGVAFDLVGEGVDLAPLASALQGELGISPYRGSKTGAGPGFSQFYAFWTQQSHADYPGLLSLDVQPRFTQPRLYVLNLIDAIWAFFEAAKKIVESGHTLVESNVLDCLRGKPPCDGEKRVKFAGASGDVAFDPVTGERDTLVHRAQYSLVNMEGIEWVDKGSWAQGDGTYLTWYEAVDGVSRPGPIPEGQSVTGQSEASAYTSPDQYQQAAAPESSPSATSEGEAKNSGGGGWTWVYSSSSSSSEGGSGVSGGTVAALVVLSVTLLLTTIGAVLFWHRSRKSRHPDHQQFSRMI